MYSVLFTSSAKENEKEEKIVLHHDQVSFYLFEKQLNFKFLRWWWTLSTLSITLTNFDMNILMLSINILECKWRCYKMSCKNNFSKQSLAACIWLSYIAI
jgi:hypothetical protein